MPDSKDLIQQVAQEIEASRTTSPTPPGPTRGAREPDTETRIEAINQVFALFRLNYHNQYYAAFPDAEQLKQIKKLWLDALSDYPVEQILKGARHAIMLLSQMTLTAEPNTPTTSGFETPQPCPKNGVHL